MNLKKIRTTYRHSDATIFQIVELLSKHLQCGSDGKLGRRVQIHSGLRHELQHRMAENAADVDNVSVRVVFCHQAVGGLRAVDQTAQIHVNHIVQIGEIVVVRQNHVLSARAWRMFGFRDY